MQLFEQRNLRINDILLQIKYALTKHSVFQEGIQTRGKQDAT